MKKNKIYNMDCADGFDKLKDNSVDIVFTDPPYNVKKDYDNYSDDLSEDKYKDWMKFIVSESRRVSKKGIIFYVGSKLTKFFYELIPDAHLVIVHKRAVGIMEGNYFLQYHSLFSTVKPKKKTKDLWNDVRLPGEGYFFREKRYDNPGLTSLALLDKVIKTYTCEDNLILDPFMGTGTTGVSCKKNNRNYIGFDTSPKYCEIARKRISKVEPVVTSSIMDFVE
ncbi:MAG: site-specific DNA-methyltransferase [Kosmotogaceae bacterium]